MRVANGAVRAARQRGDPPTDPRPSRYGRWRALSLILVYVLIAVHITHWLIKGKTLAPLELNEVMYTLELGILTAGFVFMIVAIAATAIFGRFFCSWGCHVLALQDLCAWLLHRTHIRPRGVHSRLLLWVPAAAALYMFVWPQVTRIWEGRSPPILHITTDQSGWASFTTEHFWRNLPGPGITALTFAVCGFGIVYVLGSRAFCRYGCPYGAVFGLVDRAAPGRIRVGDDCTQCGACTAACTSHIRVHEELNRFGMVVNSACMKDLDCISACSQQSLHFGFGRPALGKRIIHATAVQKQYEFALWEAAIRLVLFLAVLIVYRGLYDLVPFFLSIAIGAILAYAGIVLIRLVRADAVKFNRWQLKAAGGLLPAGVAFTAVAALAFAFTVYSAAIRYAAVQGDRWHRFAIQTSSSTGTAAELAVGYLEWVDRWGLVATQHTGAALADLYSRCGQWADAERQLRRLSARDPHNAWSKAGLGRALAEQGMLGPALAEFTAALAIEPDRAETHYSIAGLQFKSQNPVDALNHLREAVRLKSDFVEARYDLGALLVRLGDVQEGMDHLQRTLELRPDFGDAHYNLAVALAALGRVDDARQEIDRAAVLQPNDPLTITFRSYLAGLPAGPRINEKVSNGQ